MLKSVDDINLLWPLFGSREDGGNIVFHGCFGFIFEGTENSQLDQIIVLSSIESESKYETSQFLGYQSKTQNLACSIGDWTKDLSICVIVKFE